MSARDPLTLEQLAAVESLLVTGDRMGINEVFAFRNWIDEHFAACIVAARASFELRAQLAAGAAATVRTALSAHDLRAIKRAAQIIESEAETIRRSCMAPDGTFPEPGDRVDHEARMRAAGELRGILRRHAPRA